MSWRELLIGLEPYERETHEVIRREEQETRAAGQPGFAGGLSHGELEILARAGRNNLRKLDAAAKGRYFLVEEELEARLQKAGQVTVDSGAEG
jgi:hypothetical protein